MHSRAWTLALCVVASACRTVREDAPVTEDASSSPVEAPEPPAAVEEQVTPSADEVDALRKELCDLALEVAAELGYSLDFSVDSVRAVDRILTEVHEEFAETGYQEGMEGLAFEFGAYLTYVIERNYTPGVWRASHPNFGEGAFTFEWEGQTLFPVSWCMKQIENGEEDSVWMKFDVLVVRRAEQAARREE